MTGQKKRGGTVDRTFLQGLDLILGSLIQKNEDQPGVSGTDVVLSVPENGNGAIDKQKESTKRFEGTASLSEPDKPEADSLGIATDLGDKTNLPPEMGRKGDKGSEGLIDDGSIAEPMLRRRDVRKSVLGDIDRGVDLFKLWANVDKIIEKSLDYSPHVSDVDILKSFELCECTKTEDIIESTLVYKMLTDRGNRPSIEWWNECVTFAKSVEGMEEPAFFAAFMYYEPDDFNPEHFMKGLNDTGGTPMTSGRGVSHDTEIDENIGAAGGQAIDGLGMSNDGDDDNEMQKNGGGGGVSTTSPKVTFCSHDGKNFGEECDCPNHESPLHKG